MLPHRSGICSESLILHSENQGCQNLSFLAILYNSKIIEIYDDKFRISYVF